MSQKVIMTKFFIKPKQSNQKLWSIDLTKKATYDLPNTNLTDSQSQLTILTKLVTSYYSSGPPLFLYR